MTMDGRRQWWQRQRRRRVTKERRPDLLSQGKGLSHPLSLQLSHCHTPLLQQQPQQPPELANGTNRTAAAAAVTAAN